MYCGSVHIEKYSKYVVRFEGTHEAVKDSFIWDNEI